MNMNSDLKYKLLKSANVDDPGYVGLLISRNRNCGYWIWCSPEYCLLESEVYLEKEPKWND